jgi:aminoglycoside phosphotransferase (APT) family kinase protein
MEEDNALSTGLAAWCAGDRVGDPVSDFSLIAALRTILNASARDAVSRGLNEGVVTIRRLF